MTLVDEIRERRIERLGYDPDDPTDQRAARREYTKGRSRRDDQDRANFEAGRRAERDRTRPKAKARPKSRRAGRRPATKRAVRQLARPVAQQVTSGVKTLGLTLSVVALYLVLTSEEQTGAFSGVLGGLSKGLRWLSDPTASIPYHSGA